MRKLFVSICMASVVFAISSCRTAEQAVALSSINGEWNIVEIGGTKVTPNESGNPPFITFDTAAGRMSGNSGCNRMMGGFDVNAKPGSIEFKAVGGTKMMCADMTTEKNVLSALAKVKGYKKAGKDKIYLCNASNRPEIVLEKKDSEVKVAMLKGDWKIAEVNGEAVPSDMETKPFLSFDLKENRMHGNGGCNVMNGKFETNEANAKSISFPGIITTMMACPSMEIESNVLKALNGVKSFDVLSGGGIGLYDADNTLVLVLTK